MLSLKKVKTKYLAIATIVISFISVLFFPFSENVSRNVNDILGVVGLLFAILVGFFITDLWTRFQRIRENVAVEVSGLQTFYLFVKVMSHFPGHKSWAEREKELIDEYVRKFFEIEWTNYGEIDPYFNRIIESLEEIGDLKTNNEVETYTNMLPLLNEVTTAREKLFMYGKDKLTMMEWVVILFLAAILVFSIFIIRVPTFASVFLSGTLISAVIVLLLILRDLNNLSYGEEMVSFEPYETIFDVIEKPRFYLKRDIDSGRVNPPKNSEYRVGG